MKNHYELICNYCNKPFFRDNKQKFKPRINVFCSQKCSQKFNITSITKSCANCGKSITRDLSVVKKSKSGRFFCSSSCAATYNNTHKKHGTRVSKLEVWLASKLPEIYPNLKFHFNRKDTINSELDIYIPNLKLAFELNGIFHYEPIYGEQKLNQIQNNDQRKFQACLEQGIEFCTIDVSQFSYFKPQKAEKYLKIIIEIIDRNI
jgi:endogenous inhibitor of DNA gyrase (YacG/DUF329 family)